MFNKYTYTHNQDSKVFFVSDTHFCHDKEFIWGNRNFSNVQEHDEKLIQEWNNRVSVNDTVIHLGDFLVGAGNNSKQKVIEIINRLNGKIHFIWGNHNAGVKDIYKDLVKQLIPQATDNLEIYPLNYNQKFTFYGNNLLARVVTSNTSYLFYCSHFAHRIWIDSHHGDVYHISGHSHGSDPESQPDFLDAKRLDVGIENFGGPVILEDILKIMKNKSFKSFDHHDKNTNRSFKK